MAEPSLILLVDDEQVNLDLFSAILQEEGYRILNASSAGEALQLLQDERPDLIISDIHMPDMGGFEFYEKVQENQTFRSVPFIFLTALADRQHLHAGKEMGADDYLTKPIDIDELVTTVRGKLKRAASRRSAVESEFNALKEQILATLSHEMRTPLTSIIGFSEIISRSDSQIAKSELKEFARLILQGGDRLKSLVDDFLETIQIDAGKTAEFYLESKKAFDVSKAVSLVAREYCSMAEQKGIQFHSRVSEGLKAEASETLVCDIVRRLLSNAIKFTSHGKVIVSASSNGDHVRVEIADTGCGIPKSELPRVCEKFYQANKAKHQQQGAGLGLYIASNLAKINRCKFDISSTEGVGSKVTLNIPVC
jgi:two-component system sensor histidine kinase/response regulator